MCRLCMFNPLVPVVQTVESYSGLLISVKCKTACVHRQLDTTGTKGLNKQSSTETLVGFTKALNLPK